MKVKRKDKRGILDKKSRFEQLQADHEQFLQAFDSVLKSPFVYSCSDIFRFNFFAQISYLFQGLFLLLATLIV